MSLKKRHTFQQQEHMFLFPDTTLFIIRVNYMLNQKSTKIKSRFKAFDSIENMGFGKWGAMPDNFHIRRWFILKVIYWFSS